MAASDSRAAGHVICCLDISPSNEAVIRTAWKNAQAMGAPLTALYVENQRHMRMTEQSLQILRANVRYAESLGARIEIVQGENTPFIIAEYCRMHQATQLVLGRSNMHTGLMRRRSLADDLMRQMPGMDIHIVPDFSVHRAPPLRTPKLGSWKSVGADLLRMVIMLLTATSLCFIFDRLQMDEAVIAPVYILAVLIVAINTDHVIWSVVCAALAVLLFNFFFAAPRFSLDYYNKDYMLLFVITFTVSLIAGFLGSRLHHVSTETASSSRRTSTLLETSHVLQDTTSPAEVVPSLCTLIAHLTERKVLFYTWKDGEPCDVQLFTPNESVHCTSEEVLPEKETAAKAARTQELCGNGTSTDPEAQWTYFPWNTRRKMYGVLGVAFDESLPPTMEVSMIQAMISEAALVMENRIQQIEMQEARLRTQSADLRSNILRAISHDLRTPLTSIIGNVSTLLDHQGQYTNEQRNQIWHAVYDNSVLLSNMVENMLTAAKLDNGKMPVKESPEVIDDVIDAALHAIAGKNTTHPITTVPSDDILMCRMDATLITLAISNMILNAIQHTPAGSSITIRSYAKDGRAVVEVADNGKGVSDEMKVHIFELFYTGAGQIADSTRSLGLGLYLCKAIVDAHQGLIWVKDNDPKGAVFAFEIPMMDLY